MPLIPAYKRDDALWEEIESSRDECGVKIWRLGQSVYLLPYQSRRELIDPYLSDSLAQNDLDADKPHVRVSELVIHPYILKDIEIVTSSHNLYLAVLIYYRFVANYLTLKMESMPMNFFSENLLFLRKAVY